MVYYLMHENKRLAVFDIAEDKIEVLDITKNMYDMPYLPYTSLSDGMQLKYRLVAWLKRRMVPITRDGILEEFKCGQKLFNSMIKNSCVSLTDHYWLANADKLETWEDVNAYTNKFKFIDRLDLKDDAIGYNPSLTLKGDLKKKWIIDQNGIRRLVKGNRNESCRQSLSEVLATEIHKRQGKFEYTPYSLIQISSDNQIITGCECPNFTDISTEFISAIEILDSIKKSNSQNWYETYIQYCGTHGINMDYMRAFMEYQILTDFVITNTDRHLNNFGVIRDSQSLKFIKPAPIFDSGNSMFYNSSYVKVDYGILNIGVTSFKKHEVKLLEYVTNPNLVDISLLPSVSEVRNLLNKDVNVNSDILDRVASAYDKKVMLLKEFQDGTQIYSYAYLRKHGVKLSKQN